MSAFENLMDALSRMSSAAFDSKRDFHSGRQKRPAGKQPSMPSNVGKMGSPEAGDGGFIAKVGEWTKPTGGRGGYATDRPSAASNLIDTVGRMGSAAGASVAAVPGEVADAASAGFDNAKRGLSADAKRIGARFKKDFGFARSQAPGVSAEMNTVDQGPKDSPEVLDSLRRGGGNSSAAGAYGGSASKATGPGFMDMIRTIGNLGRDEKNKIALEGPGGDAPRRRGDPAQSEVDLARGEFTPDNRSFAERAKAEGGPALKTWGGMGIGLPKGGDAPSRKQSMIASATEAPAKRMAAKVESERSGANALEVGGRRNRELGTTADPEIQGPVNQKGQELLDALGKAPGKGKGDLREAMLIAGLSMLADNGNTSSWDAISKGALAGVDAFKQSRDKSEKDAEKDYDRGVEKAKTGYQMERDRVGDFRSDRQLQAIIDNQNRDDAYRREDLQFRRQQGESETAYRNRMAANDEARTGILKSNAEKGTGLDQVYSYLDKAEKGDPLAARALEIYKPARADPGAIAAAKAILSDPAASPADKARAYKLLGVEDAESEMDGLFD